MDLPVGFQATTVYASKNIKVVEGVYPEVGTFTITSTPSKIFMSMLTADLPFTLYVDNFFQELLSEQESLDFFLGQLQLLGVIE